MSYQYDRLPNAFSRDDAHYVLGVISGEVMMEPKLGVMPLLHENAGDEIFVKNYNEKKCRMAGAESDAVLADTLDYVLNHFKTNKVLFETIGLDKVDLIVPTRIVDQSKAHIIARTMCFVEPEMVQDMQYGVDQFIEIGKLFVRDAHHHASKVAADMTRDVKITAYDGYEKSIAAKFNKLEIKG